MFIAFIKRNVYHGRYSCSWTMLPPELGAASDDNAALA